MINRKFGKIQQNLVNDLLKYGKTDKIQSYFNTTKFMSKYKNSFENAIEVLKNENIKIKFMPGTRGGYYNGYYTLES